MTLSDVLLIKYPSANFIKDIIIQDDGEGAYIKEWNLDITRPSEKELQQWLSDPSLKEQVVSKQKDYDIIEQLKALDAASIRPLREGDTNKLEELTQQAVALREQLSNSGE